MTKKNFVSITSLHDIESMGNITRYEKGFYFEMNIQTLLDKHNISYEGNPMVFNEWKRHTNTGHDIKILDLHLKVECKYLSKPIYESWFNRDWLSRDADIFVTTDPYHVPYKCRKQLTQKRMKLLTPYQLIIYLIKLLNGNKCNLNRYTLQIVFTSLLLDYYVSRKAKYQRTRLKDLFTWLIELFKSILHKSLNTETTFASKLNSLNVWKIPGILSITEFVPGIILTCGHTKYVFYQVYSRICNHKTL